MSQVEGNNGSCGHLNPTENYKTEKMEKLIRVLSRKILYSTKKVQNKMAPVKEFFWEKSGNTILVLERQTISFLKTSPICSNDNIQIIHIKMPHYV